MPHSPVGAIAKICREYDRSTDAEVIAALEVLPALPDESDPAWNDEAFWNAVAYRYLALANVARERRLRAALRPLLDRACFGDPGEIMRGLRHALEAIVAPEWDALTEVCVQTVRSPRLGTKLWSLEQLGVLRDPRARSTLVDALAHEDPWISGAAKRALDALDRHDKLR